MLTPLAAAALCLAALNAPCVAAAPAQSQPPAAGAAEAARLSRSVIELYGAGKHKEALPLAERAVALLEKESPPGDVALGHALTNLAVILEALEKFDRACDAYERALPILVGKLGGDADAANQVRENLAAVLFRKGEHGRAEQLLRLALASRERKFGAGHESVTHTLVSLASLYLATREAEKRDATYRRLLDAAERTPGELSKEVGEVFGRYICTGVDRPDASDEKRAIHERIQKVFEASREAGQQGAALDGGVLNGRAVSKPPPHYPLQAKQHRTQGTVIVKITVDETGRVVEAVPLCGPQALFGASVAAARQARFTPALLGGRPVKVKGTISYNFVIR